MSQSGKVLKFGARFEVPGVRDGAQKVLLVAPSSFSTLATAGVLALTLPNGDAFVVPAGHVVKSMIVRAPVDMAGNSLDIGLNTSASTTSATLVDGITAAQVNAGAYCGQVLAAGTPILASASDQYVTVTAMVADNTAGSLECVLDIVKCDF